MLVLPRSRPAHNQRTPPLCQQSGPSPSNLSRHRHIVVPRRPPSVAMPSLSSITDCNVDTPGARLPHLLLHGSSSSVHQHVAPRSMSPPPCLASSPSWPLHNSLQLSSTSTPSWPVVTADHTASSTLRFRHLLLPPAASKKIYAGKARPTATATPSAISPPLSTRPTTVWIRTVVLGRGAFQAIGSTMAPPGSVTVSAPGRWGRGGMLFILDDSSNNSFLDNG